MAKYRKRPVIVEAVQWWPGMVIQSVFYEVEYTTEDLDGERIIREKPYVVTIHEQRAYLAPGDWIITEPDNKHHYPCKPDIFTATYEEVNV